MNYITSTELRTKTSELVKALKKGQSVSLLHHSRIIGTFEPKIKDEPVKIVDVKALKKFLDEIKPKKLIPRKDRDKIYRKHLEEKYGKGLS